MSVVMSAPIASSKKRIMRARPNPNDLATIVSIYPKDVTSIKHTIFPGRFTVAGGSYDKPGITLIGQSSWFLDNPQNDTVTEIVCGADEVAGAVVNDWAMSLLLYGEDAGPGMFYVMGNFSVNEIKVKHKDKLDQYLQRQKNWYQALVNEADINWSRAQQNPLAISDQMRMAAQELGIKTKAWMENFSSVELQPCPNCGAQRNVQYPTCGVCKAVIDPEKFKALGLKYAQ